MKTLFPYPPSPGLAIRHLIVSANSHGRWIVQNEQGRVCAYFHDRAAALRFAALESDLAEAAVTILPADIEIAPLGQVPRADEAPYGATAAALLI